MVLGELPPPAKTGMVSVEDVGYGVRVQTNEGPYYSVDVLLTRGTVHLVDLTAKLVAARVAKRLDVM
jgi:hypothetical protein